VGRRRPTENEKGVIENDLLKNFEGLENYFGEILGGQGFQIIEEMMAVSYTTREISYGIIGDFNFHSKNQMKGNLEKNCLNYSRRLKGMSKM
jgi:hypothetical protein